MLSTPKPLLLVTLFAALAPLSAAQTLDGSQAAAGALVAKAAANAATLTCTPLPRALDCVVDRETRRIDIGDDQFRAYYPDASTKVELLTPGISHDYDVYYEFDRAAFAALLKGAASSVAGTLEEKVERVAPRSTPASCTVADAAPRSDYYALTGAFDFRTRSLTTSRARGASPLVPHGWTVDERCGTLAAPQEYSLNFFVTPQHYWGEDVLQLPQSVLGRGAAPFQANLHLCQYDGEWHSSENVAELCTLAP
jgi:hypothetical protein